MGRRVDLELTGSGVAVLTLHGDNSLNVFDLEMRDELIAALAAVGDLPDVAAMVLCAHGKHFSAGADLKEFGTEDSIVERRRIRWDRDPWTPLWELPCPTIAAITGVAMGAGLEMSLLCDIRFAAPGSVLALPEPKLGMLPSAGGSQSALRAVGAARALRLCLLGESLGPERAAELGLLHRVCEDPRAAALTLAERLATLPPGLLRSARVVAHAALELGGEEARALERTHAAIAAGAA